MAVLMTTAWFWIADAADLKPGAGPGATKEEVISGYGLPKGQSKVGSREILSYAQGRVILNDGRVDRMDFSPLPPLQAPQPAPRPPSGTKVEAPVDLWLTSFGDVTREAGERNIGILILFTGSDWSLPSRQFSEEVAFHPDFVNAFSGKLVFLQLDYPARAPQSPEVR